ncbi:MAG: Bug family tripartite tricarboxylate transporter substrate binding protein [Advenella sp.]
MSCFRNRWRYMACAIGLSIAVTATADDFPSRQIQIIVPYAAGGSTDQLARSIQEPMSKELGQPVIVINKPGAAGTIGVDYVVRAKPDGYTLVFGNTGPNAIVQLTREVPYDPLTDLRPISTVALTPMILAVPASSPAKTVKEFIAYAKKEGNSLSFGSTGNGGISHFSGVAFNNMAHTKMVHIPYNGGAPMLPAFGGGQLDAAFLTGLDGTTMLSSGLVRYLAVGTQKPTDVAPGLETIDKDVPGFKSVAWFGILAPKGTPDNVIDQLNRAISKAVATPAVKKLFTGRWVEPHSSTPGELADIIKQEVAQWKPVAEEIRAQ